MSFEIGLSEIERDDCGKVLRVRIPVEEIAGTPENPENRRFTVVFENHRGKPAFPKVEAGDGRRYDELDDRLQRILGYRAKAALAVQKDPILVLAVDRETKRVTLAYLDRRGPNEVMRYKLVFGPHPDPEKRWVSPVSKEFYDELGRPVNICPRVDDGIYRRMAVRACAILFGRRNGAD